MITLLSTTAYLHQNPSWNNNSSIKLVDRFWCKETNSLKLKNATFTNLYVCQFVFMGQIFMCKLWPFFQNGLRLLFTILES